MSDRVRARSGSDLAAHLLRQAEVLSPDAYYRLARMVARVLVSRRLRERRKWCEFAKHLSKDFGVEDRLVWQAISWLRRTGKVGQA